MFPQGGNVTDISNFTFPSSLQNTETRYFVLWALYLTSVQVCNFRKESLCVSVKTRKVSHRHSVAFPLTCLKFRKGIIDYFVKTRNSWRLILLDLRYNISHKDTECTSQKPRSSGRICVTHRFAIKPPSSSNIKNGFQSLQFLIVFIITDKLLPPITGRWNLLKCAFWEIYEWHSTKDIRVYSSWIFQYTSCKVCALNTSWFKGVLITYSRLEHLRIRSFLCSERGWFIHLNWAHSIVGWMCSK